jgi:predicted Zn-dependent protease
MGSRRRRWLVVAIVVLTIVDAWIVVASTANAKKADSAAKSAVEQFHAKLNDGQSHDIYAGVDDVFRRAQTEPEFQRFFSAWRQKLGRFEEGAASSDNVNWRPQGTLVTLTYESRFANGSVQEEFTWVIKDTPKLRRYWINSAILSPSRTPTRPLRVRLVPVLASRAYLEYLQSYYRDQLGIDVEVMPPLEPDRSAWDEARQQWQGQALAEQVRRYAEADDAVAIAVLGDDMYLRGYNWRFAFGWRPDDDRVAVVAYARMNPIFSGEPRNVDQLRARLRRMVTRELGFMLFGLRVSSNPESVLYRNLDDIHDLDAMNDDLAEAGFPRGK